MNKEKLIEVLRKAAKCITPENYNWMALGQCNCGHLIQAATGLTHREICYQAIKKQGDWQSVSKLHEPNSGWEIDNTITIMLDLGLTIEDFTTLENLSNSKILERLNVSLLERDNPSHCIMYLKSWADMLEEEIIQAISLRDLDDTLTNNSYDKLPSMS